ncbi:SEC10/PgrA surface exclusion domain-containing protein [Streptococcus pluranimalium]|uniref:SEC10/PgrA surface exclusion domain-containing protein n=1 Tax=Streptococcus pluranimalium TaxID=82348 RepID=UPI003F690317
MFKNEIKGHGTIKKLRTGAVVSVLALSVAGVSGVVSADEVTATDASTVVTAEASEGVSEPILVETPKVTDADVASAKVVATEANQAVTAQESVVTNAENAVVTNDATVTDLNKQIEEVDTVTLEVVEEAKADETSAEGDLAIANETVTSAEGSLSDASSKVEAQEGVVSEARAEADKTASAVADTEKKVEGLSTATDTSKLEQDVDDLTTKVAEDTTNVQSAKDALDAAKLAETNKAQAIEDQKSVVADAEKVVDETAKGYSDAINAQKGTQATEDSAKSTLDEAKVGLASITGNILKNHDDYASLLKQYWANPSQELSEQIAVRGRQIMEEDWGIPTTESLINVATEDLFESGTFSQADIEKVVDPKNLSQADKLDLAKFVALALSDVRNGLGQSQLVVDEDVMKLSQRITELTRAENFIGHDLLAISQASKEVSVRDSYQDESGTIHVHPDYLVGEAEAFPVYEGTLTMAGLKKKVLYQLAFMVYADAHSNWGHTKTLLYSDTDFGIALNDKETPLYNVMEFRFNTLNDSSRKFTDFSGKQHIVENTSVTLKAKVDEAQKAYDEAVKANQVAKDRVAEKETAYKDAQTKFETAQKQLADLQNGTVDIPSLEQAVKDAEAQLEKDQASLQTSKETLALAKASAVDKANALAKAKDELADAKTSDVKARGVLAKEKETLEVLTKAKEVATMALDGAKSKQATAQTAFDTARAKASDLSTKLANKETVLADLNAKLADATAKSSVLRAELETAKELLATLKADANAKNAEYIRILGLKAEQDKAEAEAEVGTNQVVNIQNISSQTNQSVHNKAITAKITQNIVSRHQAGKTSYQASLPETGDESSLFAIMGVSLLLGLGFVGKRRKV